MELKLNTLTGLLDLWNNAHLVDGIPEPTNLDKSNDIEGDPKWDKRFLNLAEHISSWSKDPSTKVGAVIVNEKNHILSVGYNGFPRGVSDSEVRYNTRDVKYMYVCHAERNALDNAHTDVSGCTLYSTLLCCNECAKSIIQRGIKRVVCYEPDRDGAFMNWDVTGIMFREAGVQLDIQHK